MTLGRLLGPRQFSKYDLLLKTSLRRNYSRTTSQAMYVAAPITISTITAAKVSVILLYRRVFLLDNAFRVGSNIVGVLCLLWWISFVFTVLFQCTPVQKSWKLEIPGHCVDGGLGFLLSESLSCVLDFAIILLPVRVIRKMKLPLAQKIMLCFIFIMGSL